MDSKKLDILADKIKEAELILIGIGEEWEAGIADLLKSEKYKNLLDEIGKNNPLLPFIQKELLEDESNDEIVKRYNWYKKLESIISNKNYFIVSLCTDGLIKRIDFKEDRVVEPCGSFSKLQCSEKCTADLYNPDDIKIPVCPHCGKLLVFNNIYAENYAEEGYTDKWQIYMKWLQGTVNRNVCIMELGVGMRFPSVIRWPFEKVAFFNQKANFFRVHSTLYQTAEEIKDRSYGIKADPEEFLKELYNRL